LNIGLVPVSTVMLAALELTKWLLVDRLLGSMSTNAVVISFSST
jgi:hypothetical protein